MNGQWALRHPVTRRLHPVYLKRDQANNLIHVIPWDPSDMGMPLGMSIGVYPTQAPRNLNRRNEPSIVSADYFWDQGTLTQVMALNDLVMWDGLPNLFGTALRTVNAHTPVGYGWPPLTLLVPPRANYAGGVRYDDDDDLAHKADLDPLGALDPNAHTGEFSDQRHNRPLRLSIQLHFIG